MIKQRRFDLTVIVASCRPKWLANCLRQLEYQDFQGTWEVVVIAEGPPAQFDDLSEKYTKHRFIYKEEQGGAGAFAKDVGIGQAFGEFVCFFDDDNIYYHDALTNLRHAVGDGDIGIARASIMGLGWRLVPEDQEIRYSNIDSMCLCVRRTLAQKARWSDHLGRGTDYFWVKKLLDHAPSVSFSEAVVGEHLN